MSKFIDLLSLDVNEYIEKKGNLSYLSWSNAWKEFKKVYPLATYELIKGENMLPYFESTAGAMVFTKVTAEDITYEMWLPVMDHKNKSIKPEQLTMTDVNKTIMRCLVKNLAMFGLGLYIYSGEDLPEQPEQPEQPEKEPIDINNFLLHMGSCQTIDELKYHYIAYVRFVKDNGSDKDLLKQLDDEKNRMKNIIAKKILSQEES